MSDKANYVCTKCDGAGGYYEENKLDETTLDCLIERASEEAKKDTTYQSKTYYACVNDWLLKQQKEELG